MILSCVYLYIEITLLRARGMGKYNENNLFMHYFIMIYLYNLKYYLYNYTYMVRLCKIKMIKRCILKQR